MFLTTQFSITARNVLVAASVEVATLSVCGAADTRSRELEGLYGDEKTLEIALGYRKPLVDVPNVATVIEETDIRRVGARTLAEALVLAPGVQVVHGRGRIRLLNLRGIFADLGPDVLVKRNGVPISQGSFTTFNPFDLLPTNNIDRIEIIRGPNSALDGADALAGVVNIVTKPSVGLRGTELGGRAGSQDTYDVWLNHGSKLGPIDVAVGLSAWTTQGHDKTLGTDVQSQMDRLLGTRSSLAPGPLNMENEGTDMELDVSTGPWRMRLGYYGVLHAGIGAGTVQVLDPDGHVETHLFNTDLVYNAALTPELELSGLFSYVNKWEFLSETFVPPGGRPGFPSGIAGEIENNARLFRGEAAAIWSGWRDHKLRVAGGAYSRTNDEPKQRANVRTTTRPDGRLVRIPLPGFREMTGNELAFPENSATTAFGSLLDEWRFAPDWTLTTGLRFDGFSDVGISVTPRLALVWDASHATTLKWLYGRGFRPPTFLEKLTRPNQGLVAGNPGLRPQVLDMLELQVSNWSDRYTVGLNAFGYKIHDQITVVDQLGSGLTFRNQGEQTGYGLELEGSYALTDRLRLNGYYAFRNTLDRTTNSIGAGPEHLVYGEALWEFIPKTFFDVNVRAVLDRERAQADPRPPLDDYCVVNLALQREGVLRHVDLALSARNILDADARDPSSNNELNSVLPLADIPLAGREIWGEIRLRF